MYDKTSRFCLSDCLVTQYESGFISEWLIMAIFIINNVLLMIMN